MTQDTQVILETPLAAIHRAAGAAMGVWFGCDLPDNFGHPQEEQRFANESVALIDKNYRAYFAFTGPDRVRYVNAILTNNVKDLKAGEGAVSLLLSAQGRILAEIETYAEADRLFCVSHRMIREGLAEILEKYIIMDDVTLSDETENFGTLRLEGPKTAEVVRELTGIDVEQLRELTLTAAVVKFQGDQTPVTSASNVHPTPPIEGHLVKQKYGAEFVVKRENLPTLWPVLLQSVRKHGGGPMGYQALSAQSLVQCIPWFGYDFGEKQIPHEAGLELSHISYTKGCYTGQEIVERVRSRGQVNRRRVQLIFPGDAVPESGAELTANGQAAGYVTRATRSFFPTQILGMGYLSKDHRAPGTRVQWSGGEAKVVASEDVSKRDCA